MKAKLLSIMLLFLVVIAAIAGGTCFAEEQRDADAVNGEYIVALNEIKQLAAGGDASAAAEKTDALADRIRGGDSGENGGKTLAVLVVCGLSALAVLLAFGYVCFAVLRPFDRMKKYAERIASGDFDLPLDYERSNYFGEFTWAFDSMRREITKSRSCEREAIENNKTVIATLSHDIKTPIASIRAYSEGLEANLDGSPEKRAKYLNVIMKKCDEVSALANDLFIHSLSDLDKLKMFTEKAELCGFTAEILAELDVNKHDIHIAAADFAAYVNIDRNRYTQLVENIVNNARKYAKTDISVRFVNSDEFAEVHFCDNGGGIPNEDIPFIFDKFYRGKNCGAEQGSGLGLYIVRYIARQLYGDVALKNNPDGLEVILTLPKII